MASSNTPDFSMALDRSSYAALFVNAQMSWTGDRGRDLLGLSPFRMGSLVSSLAAVGSIRNARIKEMPFAQYSIHLAGTRPTTDRVEPLCIALPVILAALR